MTAVAFALVVAFLLVPVVEIYVIIQVGQLIGALPTVALLVVESLLGAWLVKRQGRVVWSALRQATAAGRLPGRELADAGLVLVGGTLLLTPGFVTDVVGFFLVLPPTRPLARRGLWWLLGRRASRGVVRHGLTADRRGQRPAAPPPGDRPPRVVPGETVDEGGPRRDGDGPGSGTAGRG